MCKGQIIMKLHKQFLTFFQIFLLLAVSQSLQASALENHPSPYLRMHQTDPVKWQTWGPKVLQQAKAENKLIFISIGYFSCHWCHVMQKESYSQTDIGEILNQHFIPVKVDRELRPELDRRMIQFVESVRGQSGWPLNVFITPDGYPITGFTYLPRNDFKNVLEGLSTQWSNDYKELSVVAKDYFLDSEKSEKKSSLLSLPDEHFSKVVDAFVSQAMLIGDDLQGGFGTTNKFPSYPHISSLLKAIQSNPDIDPDVIEFFHLTLDAMATKHMMDHVGFGFYRYVVDPDWQTPHFEKMLYDNAQLASLYFDAHTLSPDKGYADIALRTLQFMNEFMANGQGGFNASLSAVDIHNIEGGAYYYDAIEFKKALLPDDYAAIKAAWVFRDEETLIQTQPLMGLGASLDSAVQMARIHHAIKAIPKDPMPIDTKALASWNALTLKAWVRASEHTKNKDIQQQTKEIYSYLIQNFIANGTVIKFAGQRDAAETTLEDYAQLAHAIQLYANYSHDEQAAKFAKTLTELAFKKYYKNKHWLRNVESLIPGDKGELVIQDAVFESPVTLLLETVFLMKNPDPEIKTLAIELLRRLTPDILDAPYFYSSLIMLRQQHLSIKN